MPKMPNACNCNVRKVDQAVQANDCFADEGYEIGREYVGNDEAGAIIYEAPSRAAQSSELWKNREMYPMIDRGEYIMHPRNSNLAHDLSDPVTVHVNTAEAILRRGIRCHHSLPVIGNLVEFNYIENKTLEKQFLDKKAQLGLAGRDDSELVLFHGTGHANTHEICSGNFNLDLSNRFAYGRGIYFSKCPNTSLQYGDDLILCRVLPGHKKRTVANANANDRTTLQPGFDSLEIDWMRNNDPGSNAIVVRTPEQILPYCVIKTEHTGGSKSVGMPMTTKSHVKAAKSKPIVATASKPKVQVAGKIKPKVAAGGRGRARPAQPPPAYRNPAWCAIM